MSRVVRLAVLVVLSTVTHHNVTAQQRERAQLVAIPQKASDFDVKDSRAVEALLNARKAAILKCTHELRHRDQLTPDETLVALRAAWLLGELRTDNQQAIEALLGNLALSERVAVEEHPLAFLPAAQALVRIGNISLRHVEEYLANHRTERELRIVAFVIVEIDGIELARFRVARTLQEYESRPAAARNANAEGLKNWRQINGWLSIPDFRDRRENWP